MLHKFSFLIVVLCLVAQNVGAADFTPPEQIENLNSTKTRKTANLSRIEEWVWLSYFVDEQGLASKIEVIDASHPDSSNYAAINYLENLRYASAVFKGKAVSSAATFFFRLDKSFTGSANDGISRGFRRHYNDADNFINSGEMDKAGESLAILLEDYTKNTTEQALSAWLHSNYYFKQQQWNDYGAAIQTAHYLNQSLPLKLRIKNAQNRMNWFVFQQAFSDANYALLDLMNQSEGNLKEDDYQALQNQIEELIANKPVNEMKVTLVKDRAWQHRLPRSRISLDLHSGSITFAELRCENGHQSFSSFPITEIDIPQDNNRCQFFVKGEAGTHFTFKEEGELRIY